MGTKLRRRRIKRAFEGYEGKEDSRELDVERRIGKLPKKPAQPRQKHPIEVQLEQHGAVILKALRNKGGFLPLGDHSTPAAIQAEFPFSKRVFKKVVGHLWKQRKIEIIPREGIRLIEKRETPRHVKSATKSAIPKHKSRKSSRKR
jgi:hypothetical protein